MSFENISLSPEVMTGLNDMGFTKPTPIQQDAIPVILEGKDILASAQTGTGKTAAFAIPIIEDLFKTKGSGGIQVLILAPTRELAQQIDEQFWTIGYHTGITSVCVYGGGDWGTQQQAVKNGVDVIVATPGRLIDLIKFMNLDFSKLRYLVLDEADRMLDMGFLPDVKSIIYRLPKKRRSLLFSATISDRVEALASDITHNPVRINVSSFKTAEGVTQIAYRVNEQEKFDLVIHLYETMKWPSCIIFMSTKRGAADLTRSLRNKKVAVGSMHGDMDQAQREATLADFRNNKISTIVATDVMSRGIDITNVSHVINFSVPRDLDDYIHRIGRTARAEKKGTAITFVTREDARFFKPITDHIGSDLEIKNSPVSSGGNSSHSTRPPVNPNERKHPRTPSNRAKTNSNTRQQPARSEKPRQHEPKSELKKPYHTKQTSTGEVNDGRNKPAASRSESKRKPAAPQTQHKKQSNGQPELTKQERLIKNILSPSLIQDLKKSEKPEGGIFTVIKRLFRK